MDFFKYIIKHKILFHSIFWIILLLMVFFAETWEYGLKLQIQMFVQFTFAFAVFAAICYFNILYLIPRFFKAQKYAWYGLMILFTLLAGATITTLFKVILEKLGFSIIHGWKHNQHAIFYFFHMLTGQLMLILLTTFFYVLEEWIRLQSITIRLQESEGEKTRSELQALKAQINPHFLFNTLNNIYSHSLTQSPKAPEMILKLSSLMSYILYECSAEKVPVSNELEFIKNYIELEKNRFEDNLKVDLNITEDVTGKHIAPLLMIPLIENAFKHVASNKLGNNFVSVNIEIDSEGIFLHIVNSTDQLESDTNISRTGGIGIENVRKRLDLIYPNSWDLKINKSDYLFEIVLKIHEDGN